VDTTIDTNLTYPYSHLISVVKQEVMLASAGKTEQCDKAIVLQHVACYIIKLVQSF
jgi:hypothetical protein